MFKKFLNKIKGGKLSVIAAVFLIVGTLVISVMHHSMDLIDNEQSILLS